tara:strand:- start:727 stop:897 length:171 start_codon:yes stop_codon:yes gene_type:complete
MVEKSQLFFSSFTNKKGITKISANFTIEFAKKLGSLEEEAFQGFVEDLNIELGKIK